MKTSTLRLVCIMGIVGNLMVAAAMAEESPLFDVPYLDNIQIDGNPGDWGDRGFRVDILTSTEGAMLPAKDFDPHMRLAWDRQGLLVLLTVADNEPVESSSEAALWGNDSVELFPAVKRGSGQFYQAVIAPGMDPKFPKVRSYLFDRRQDKSEPKTLTIETASTRTREGYVMEVRLPWKNLSINPQMGDEVGLQICLNDTRQTDDRFRVVWYPKNGVTSDQMLMHRLRLASQPSSLVLAVMNCDYERMRRTRITVNASPELAGKRVEIREGDVLLAQGELGSDVLRTTLTLKVPLPSLGSSFGRLTASIDGKTIASAIPPDLNEQRARAFMEAPLHFRPAVFAGNQFPACDFEQPGFVEDLIGPYHTQTTFYDADYNKVEKPEKPGRYGAVVEIIPENGRVHRRFRTLFRQAERIDWTWWSPTISEAHHPKISLRLPKEFGIDQQVVSNQSKLVGDHLKWSLVDGFEKDDRTAALFAGLYESKPGQGEQSVFEDVWARDRQWWVGLKRKLYRMGQIYPDAFVSPRPLDGPVAPVLRKGSLSEAGMKADAREQIDAVCRAWSADSDEAFSVCVARHGVIVLHKAYGNREGRPMTVDDRSWMASITKMLSGSLMMMLVDQGRVNLDDPVDKFLPGFRGVTVTKPLTIRHLFTHTGGFLGPRLVGRHCCYDEHNDFDEISAGSYPYLKVGAQFQYGGTGPVLGGKIVEVASGEALPQFYKHHLLDPLGCTNTRVFDAGVGAASVPLDMAKIGQMILNRGRYGNLLFFKEETYQKMLPVKLTSLLGPETKTEWGIGVSWQKEPGLSEQTFGHGAGSGATFRIDPVNDLVIVMTRNASGTNFEKYHPQFIRSIVDGMVK